MVKQESVIYNVLCYLFVFPGMGSVRSGFIVQRLSLLKQNPGERNTCDPAANDPNSVNHVLQVTWRVFMHYLHQILH